MFEIMVMKQDGEPFSEWERLVDRVFQTREEAKAYCLDLADENGLSDKEWYDAWNCTWIREVDV